MRKFIFSGLRARILLLVALAFTPWLLSTIYQNMEVRQQIIAKAHEDALRLVNIIAYDQKNTIAEARSFLQILAALPETKKGSQKNCRQHLASVFEQTPNYVNMGVFDAHGTLLCDALATREPVVSNEREWFKQVIKPGNLSSAA